MCCLGLELGFRFSERRLQVEMMTNMRDCGCLLVSSICRCCDVEVVWKCCGEVVIIVGDRVGWDGLW